MTEKQNETQFSTLTLTDCTARVFLTLLHVAERYSLLTNTNRALRSLVNNLPKSAIRIRKMGMPRMAYTMVRARPALVRGKM